jgi:hypothetical protein
MSEVQNFENHPRSVPLFHMVALPIFLANLIWSVYRVIRLHSGESVIGLLLALAFMLTAFYARTFALTVQDRVIRLEMRLRMREILEADLHPRIPEFSVGQLVALRFANDAELPALARKVLDEKLTDRKVIKKLIQNWQADTLRA